MKKVRGRIFTYEEGADECPNAVQKITWNAFHLVKLNTKQKKHSERIERGKNKTAEGRVCFVDCIRLLVGRRPSGLDAPFISD